MRILLVNNFHHILGGGDKAYFNCIDLLNKKGHDVIHFSAKHEKNFPSPFEKYFVSNTNFSHDQSILSKVQTAKSYLNNSDAPKQLQLLIDEQKPDIAHLHIFQSRLSSSFLPVFKKNNIPVVMHVHEYKLLCPIYKLKNNKGEICEKCCTGNFVNAAINKCNRASYLYSALAGFEAYYTNKKFNWLTHIDHFIMVSDFIKQKHIQYYPQIESKSTGIYNFIDTELLEQNNAHKNYFIYTGRVSSEKGLLTLIKAWQKFPNKILKIVGGGDYLNVLKEFVKEKKLGNVEFTGFVNHDELIKIVADAKFLVMPSEWYENNPLSVLESMALGTPVIGASIGGIPELVTGERGFLFQPGNVNDLAEVIEKAYAVSDNKYKAYSDNCRKFIENNMNEDIIYRKMLNIYQNLLH